IQYAAAEALTGDQTFVKELNDMYESRRNVFIEKLNEIGWAGEAPKGTFFAWLRVPKGYTSEEFSDLLLKEAHVATARGSGFGPSGEGYVRIGLLDSEDRLAEAADRIASLDIF